MPGKKDSLKMLKIPYCRKAEEVMVRDLCCFGHFLKGCLFCKIKLCKNYKA